jgi:hypothetical protein
MGILRQPSEDTDNLYPGLTVCDDRVTGSINAGRTRLPLWAFIGTVVEESWVEANKNFEVESTGLSKRDLSDFLYNLLEMRGEFGRLLLLMAEAYRVGADEWHDDPVLCRRMQEQLQQCLKALEDNTQ